MSVMEGKRKEGERETQGYRAQKRQICEAEHQSVCSEGLVFTSSVLYKK